MSPPALGTSAPHNLTAPAPAVSASVGPEPRVYSEDDLRRALARQAAAQGQISPQAPATAGATAPVTSQSASLATIEDARVARQVLETLVKLEGVSDLPQGRDGTPAGPVATIFFDPRCPYCHAAFKALHGKVAARWIPVMVLGEPEAGKRMAAAILSAPDRVAALADTFEAKGPSKKGAPDTTGTPEMLAKLAENHEAFASIFAASPGLRPGVPTMFVPRPDGRLAIMVGYEPGDEAKLASIMAGS